MTSQVYSNTLRLFRQLLICGASIRIGLACYKFQTIFRHVLKHTGTVVAWHFRIGRHSHIEMLHQRRDDQEQCIAGECFTCTKSLARAKRHRFV